jgi:MFS family permease
MTAYLKSCLPLLACLSGLLIGYDTGIIGSAIIFIQSHFQLTETSQGMLASMLIPGVMLGILIASSLSEHIGQRICITFAAVIYFFGLMIAASALNIFLIFLARILVGSAIGIFFVTVPMYLAESSLAKFRGRFIAAFQLSITFGIFLGYCFGFWLAHYAAWRLMFAIGLLWALIVMIATLFLPSSAHAYEKKTSHVYFKDLACKEYQRPFLIGIGLAILQQATGINAVLYFAPQILLSLQHQATTAAISSALIIASGNFIFTIISLFLLDSIGRRPVLIFSFACQCVALAMLSVASYLPTDMRTLLLLICLLLYFFGFAIGLGPVTWLIIAEIYPKAIRAKAIGLTVMINNITAFLVAGFFLTVLHKLGAANTFGLFSCISFLGLLFVLRFVPETKKQSLAEIEIKLTHQSNKPFRVAIITA